MLAMIHLHEFHALSNWVRSCFMISPTNTHILGQNTNCQNDFYEGTPHGKVELAYSELFSHVVSDVYIITPDMQ